MGEIVDIGVKFREDPTAHIEIHPILLSELEQRDPTGDAGLEIVADYQLAILSGIQARNALRQAVLRARNLR